MKREGPALAVLQRRLAETPDLILQADENAVPTLALVHDLLWRHYPSLHVRHLVNYSGVSARNGWYAITRLLCWLLGDAAFDGHDLAFDKLQRLLTEGARELQASGAAHHYVQQADRREELIRMTLAQLDLRPAGETLAQAQDRLAAVSAGERGRVIEAARQAELRAREIREALARQAAQEAADKWSRE